jgi:hypothetical protein
MGVKGNMVGMDRSRWNSGVSETIGFIIIFGIVMTGIAIVTLYGYPALTQEQANANIKNMEKNMLVLQSDLKSLTFKSVPYQETTMQVSGGTLMIKKEPNPTQPLFTIDINGVTIPHYPGELRFISQDGMVNIALENGAVHTRYWSSPTGSAMLAEPSWFYDTSTHTYVIHLIKLNASSDFAQTGIGTVRMQLNDQPTTREYDITSPITAKITYQADPAEDYRIAWKNYFGAPDLHMTSPLDSWPSITYTLDPSAEKLIIKTYNVTILSL